MLDLLERHRTGILGTIVVHLALATIVLIMKINTIKQQESTVVLDLLSEEQVKEITDPEVAKEKQPAQSPQDFMKNIQQEYLGARNIATNVSDKDASDNIDKMVSEIKNELGVKDPVPSENTKTSQRAPAEDAVSDEAAKVEKSGAKHNFVGVQTFYKGPTTVSYSLDYRYHIFLPPIAYKCQGGGKVVLKIFVNQQGYVDSYEVNRAESDIPEDCIIESAERAVKSIRFNPSNKAPSKQQGTLTYVFIAQ